MNPRKKNITQHLTLYLKLFKSTKKLLECFFLIIIII